MARSTSAATSGVGTTFAAPAGDSPAVFGETGRPPMSTGSSLAPLTAFWIAARSAGVASWSSCAALRPAGGAVAPGVAPPPAPPSAAPPPPAPPPPKAASRARLMTSRQSVYSSTSVPMVRSASEYCFWVYLPSIAPSWQSRRIALLSAAAGAAA